jgi:tetratricopeptide (TPR) repeat protein
MTHRFLILVLLSLCLYTTSIAQQSKVQGYLYNDQEKPEGRVRIRALPSEGVTTANNGRFRIDFQTLGPGEGVTLVVERPNWVVYDPILGRTTTQKPIRRYIPRIYIAEKGSAILLGSKAILDLLQQFESERTVTLNDIARLQTENRRLQTQNIALTRELDAALERERENRDINVYLDRYAAFSGFTKDQVLSAVLDWAKPAPNDTDEVTGWKLFFARRYAESESVALTSAKKDINVWLKLERHQEEYAGPIIRKLHLAILNPYRERRFRDALNNYSVLEKFITENRVPTDGFQRELTNARVLSANSKAYLSRTVIPRRGPEARQLLSEAIQQFRELLTLFGTERSPRVWTTQINLGNALHELVFTIGVPDSAERLKEAQEAFREAIRIRSLTSTINQSDPSMNYELHLASALHNVGLSGGPNSVQFLLDAEQAYRSGLASLDRKVQPQDWLYANLNLGRVLQDLARFSGGDAAGYRKKAETEYRAMLAVSEDQATECGCIQASLATVLEEQGRTSRGQESLRYLNDADGAYKAALKLTSKRDMPEVWAQITINRAYLHQELGDRSRQGAENFFRQSEEAFRKVLSAADHELYGQDRVRAQSGLADALNHLAKVVPERGHYLKQAETEARKAVALSEDPTVIPCGCTIATLGAVLHDLGRLGDEKSIDYLKEAEKLFRGALPVDRQTDWRIQAGLAGVLLDLGLAHDPIDQEYIKQSVTAFREYFKNTSPESRAAYQGSFGTALHELADFEDPPNVQLLKEAEVAFLAAMEWFTFEEDPQIWIMARVDAGTIMMHLAALDDEAARATHLRKAESVYRQIFTRDIRQQYPREWVMGQRDLGMALEELAHTDEENHLERLKEAETFLRAALKFNLLQPDKVNVMPMKFRLAQVIEDLAGEESEKESSRIAFLQEAKALHQDLIASRTPETDLPGWSESMRKLAVVSRKLARLDSNSLTQLKEAEKFIQATKSQPLFDHDKEQWLRIELTHGDVLQDFAFADKSRRQKHLKNAKKLYEDALIVAARQRFPGAWVELTYELAQIYTQLEKPLDAKRLLLEVLDYNPKDRDALSSLSGIYHERLFDFAGSFEAISKLLEIHSADLRARTNFAENHFTTGRFEECAVLINNLLAEENVYEDHKIALRAIEIATLIGSGKTSEVPARLDSLIEELRRQPPDFDITWEFEGATHFAREHVRTAPLSGWLKKLFAALRKKDRDSILQAVQHVRSKFKPPKQRIAVQREGLRTQRQVAFSNP